MEGSSILRVFPKIVINMKFWTLEHSSHGIGEFLRQKN